MSKTIDTLAADIQGMFGSKEGVAIEQDVLARYGANVAEHVHKSLQPRRGGRKDKTVYMSELGTPCQRKLWYSYNFPEFAEPMSPSTLFKFVYGNLLEETALMLATAAGHTVEHAQRPVTYKLGEWTISGRMDAVIDGVLVDVKSASSYSYKKFAEGLTDSNDAFGYRTQLSAYNGLTLRTAVWTRQGFLAIDKQNGHIGFFETPYTPVEDVVFKVLDTLKDGTEPDRGFGLVPEGKSGNMKLTIECSYCPYKGVCWRDSNKGAGLKGFAYSYGPVFLGTIKRPPAVPELKLPAPITRNTLLLAGEPY